MAQPSWWNFTTNIEFLLDERNVQKSNEKYKRSHDENGITQTIELK